MEQITEVKEIQTRLNGALVHLAEVCEKNGLRFFLSNGTMLGAVKYHGFIPWDDDADVLMPREDYDKLVRLAEIDTEDYQLLATERQPEWRVPYAKLSDRHTVVQETTADFGCEVGVAVDVFPLDPWKGGRRRALLQARVCGLLRRMMSASIEETFTTPRTGVKRAILYLIWCVSRCIGHRRLCGYARWQAARGDLKAAEFIGCIVWAAYGRREVVPKALFESAVPMEFEGRAYSIPGRYDTYLRSLYGDYWQDPPPERQRTHHRFVVWDKGTQGTDV